MPTDWIVPDWPAPARIHAVSTTRSGGVSSGPYSSLNLGLHVGDNPAAVAENRRRLMETVGLKREPRWLQQVHGMRVTLLGDWPVTEAADAAVTDRAAEPCVIMTADCLPVLFSNRKGTKVGAAHAGWRGLSAGVLEATLKAMGSPPAEMLAWLGPAIGPMAYEVGEEVRQAFVAKDPVAVQAFEPGKAAGKWWCDLYMLARQRLEAVGISSIYGGDWCTLRDPDRFFSFRRDGECGRMGTFIWME